jgi:two-component sensor histidine kinase
VSGVTIRQVGARALTHVALLLHELATNAAKYGCLAEPEGRLSVDVMQENGAVTLVWTEECALVSEPPSGHGFGSRLEKSVQISLGATIEREWRETGLVVRLTIPLERHLG